MKHLKSLVIFFICLVFILSAQNSLAAETKGAVIVNPIRGEDFWTYSHSILATPQKQYEIISRNNLSATWLVRYDALKDDSVIQFLKQLNKQQDVGLFLEITPTFATDAQVNYHPGQNWHYPKSVFLTGYTQEERRKFIDTAITRYKTLFGTNPKSVGAWWVDAYSLSYIKEKYGVLANLSVTDQYSTDLYQVWGQYWSIPYYPSKNNALVPAQSAEQKIGIVTMQWATRDPYNAYGSGVFDSTYSVQVNDYLLHDLDINYFEKLLSIYPQTTVGLENDFSWNEFGTAYTDQINLLATKAKTGELTVFSMQSFADYYRQQYPTISPNVLIQARDPLGTDGYVVWYNTPKYRAGWFYGKYGSVIRDLRLYHDSQKEHCYQAACEQLDFARTESQALDEVTFNTRWVLDQGQIKDIQASQQGQDATIRYTNQVGTKREIGLYPNDIKVNDQIQPISFAILNAIKTSNDNPTKISTDSFTHQLEANQIPQQLQDLGKFILFVVMFFLLPGWLINRKALVSIPVGMAAFTLVIYLLSYLGLPSLIWGLPVVALLGIAFKRPQLRFNFSFKERFLPYLLILLGSCVWLLTNIKNGLLYDYGYGYWGPHGHDGIWHLSLISELQRNFPPSIPVFAGVSLQNYHYFFDLLVAWTGKLFFIDSQNLLFRLYPFLISLLGGVALYLVTQRLAVYLNLPRKNLFSTISLFFFYFAGSWGWLVSWMRDKGLGGESMFWAQQSISTLINPPFAISVVFLLTGLYLFYDFLNQQKLSLKELLSFGWLRKINYSVFLSLILVWGVLIEFKAYAGVLVIGGLGVLALEYLITKRDFKLLLLLIPIGLLSALIFLPTNQGSESLIEWNPLWLVNSMINSEDRLFLPRLSLIIESGVTYKVVIGSTIGIMLFFLGNLGTRVISIFAFRSFIQLRFLIYIALLGSILPLLFTQKGNNWNIVQFFYYSLLIFNIFAAISLTQIITRFKLIGIGLTIVMILLTLPTTFEGLKHYLPERPPARVSKDEIEALRFLKDQPEGMVMTQLYDPKQNNKYTEPVPLHAYTSTGYVTAFSHKPTFLEDTINLEILGNDYKGRLNLVNDFFNLKERSQKIAQDNNIDYVYVVKSMGSVDDPGKMALEKIFENNEVVVYKTTYENN